MARVLTTGSARSPMLATRTALAAARTAARAALVAWPLLALPALRGLAGAVSIADAAARPTTPLRDADYLAFADRIAAGLELRWDETLGAYVSRRKGATARTNANLLVVHAGAALYGHGGASRRDDRARRLVEHLTRAPMLQITTATLPRNRAPCWTKLLTGSVRDHASGDPQVAEALEWAWRARGALALAPGLTAAAARSIDRCARNRHWRYPRTLKNQVNWNAQLYASASRVTGRDDLLREDYRRHLGRFLRGLVRPLPGMPSANLGPGFGFHYSPELAETRPSNFDAPEYALIVATALQYLPEARAAGMAAPAARDTRLLRGWVTRLLTGAWTHAGYLNWDTGHGLGRWHSGQYWAFAQQGLLAIAATPQLWARPAYGRWAKAIFDRGLRLYGRWATEERAWLAPQLPFDVFSHHRDHDLYASRIAANAMRAIRLGLGSAGSEDPPPLYAYDRETQRLAVTTPNYSTAIVPHNHGAFEYGGIELARLFGADQEVAATIGGRPPAAFGVVVRDARGRTVLASQDGADRDATLRLEPGRAPSGPFRSLLATGRVRSGRVSITTTHRFGPRDVEVRWEVRCAGSCGPYDVDVHFPTSGEGAVVDVHGADGSTTRLAGAGTAPLAGPVALAAVDHLELGTGERSGYSVAPLLRTPGATLRTVAAGPLPTAPHPGPALVVRLLAAGRLDGTLRFAVRIRPRGA